MVLCKVHDLCKECSGDSAAEGQVFSDLSFCAIFGLILPYPLGCRAPIPGTVEIHGGIPIGAPHYWRDIKVAITYGKKGSFEKDLAIETRTPIVSTLS